MAYGWTLRPRSARSIDPSRCSSGSRRPRASRSWSSTPRRFAFAITERKQGSTKDVRYRHTFVRTPERVGGNAMPDFVLTPAVKADERKSLRNLKRKVEASA